MGGVSYVVVVGVCSLVVAPVVSGLAVVPVVGGEVGVCLEPVGVDEVVVIEGVCSGVVYGGFKVGLALEGVGYDEVVPNLVNPNHPLE